MDNLKWIRSRASGRRYRADARLMFLALLLLSAAPPSGHAGPSGATPPSQASNRGLGIAAPQGALEVATFDRWYVLELQGTRAGWMNESRRIKGGRVISDSQFRMSMRRGESSISISMESSFEETLEGEPISMSSKLAMGAAPVETRYEFGPESIRAISITQGRRSESTHDLPKGEWLTPAESSAFVRAMLASGRGDFKVREMSALEGPIPITSTYSSIESTSVSAMGRTAPAMRATLTSTSTPGVPSTVFLGEDGGVIRSEVRMGAITITMVRADRELALSKLSPPEIMASTLVEPDQQIGDPRSVTRARYVLSVPEGELPDLPHAGVQAVERIDARRVRVVVDADRAIAANMSREDREEALQSSTMIDARDERIRELARRAIADLGEGSAPLQRAEALRTATFSHMKAKGLDVGFASASEACRTGEGDCSEHAVLLAALLRAEDIPSRTVSGLIYVDEFLGKRGVFGYHMWTQALITIDGEDRWVDLDATLPPGTAFDATHIAIATSLMRDGEGVNAMAAIAPLLGSLEIRVEEVR